MLVRDRRIFTPFRYVELEFNEWIIARPPRGLWEENYPLGFHVYTLWKDAEVGWKTVRMQIDGTERVKIIPVIVREIVAEGYTNLDHKVWVARQIFCMEQIRRD